MSSRPLRPLLPADSKALARTSSSSFSSSASLTTTTPLNPAGDDSSRNNNNNSSSSSSSRSNSSVPPSSSRPPRRPAVPVACEGCRRRKVRCDGGRPACGPCRRKGAEAAAACVYAVAADDGAAPRTYGGLRAENAQLRGLYALLRDLPDADARDLLHRIRTRHDPLTLCRAVREARLLLPAGPAPPPPSRPIPPLSRAAAPPPLSPDSRAARP